MARCEYRRGENEHFVVKMALGMLGQTALRTAEAVKKAVTNPELVQDHQVNGFAATLYQDTVTGRNWVLAAILDESKPAVFEMTFVGIRPDQCLGLAKRFDWRGIAREVRSIPLQKPDLGPGLPSAL
jgi:hypothetical protein